MKMRTRTFVATLALAAPLLAFAQTDSTRRIDGRQDRQEARIERGEQSGSLTEKEAAKLERGQTHVQNMENRAAADGTVTNKERARIEHAQDVQSKRIYREKHDRQTDYNHDGRQDRPRQARNESRRENRADRREDRRDNRYERREDRRDNRHERRDERRDDRREHRGNRR